MIVDAEDATLYLRHRGSLLVNKVCRGRGLDLKPIWSRLPAQCSKIFSSSICRVHHYEKGQRPGSTSEPVADRKAAARVGVVVTTGNVLIPLLHALSETRSLTLPVPIRGWKRSGLSRTLSNTLLLLESGDHYRFDRNTYVSRIVHLSCDPTTSRWAVAGTLLPTTNLK